MPFPFTLNGNTYQRVDFTSPGYANKFADFLSDLFTSVNPVTKTEVSSIDFGNALSQTVTFTNLIAPLGGVVVVAHIPTQSYATYTVSVISGLDVTLTRLTTAPYNSQAGTYTSDVVAFLDIPATDTAPAALVDTNSQTLLYGSEDFLGYYQNLTGGSYTGSNGVAGTTIQNMPVSRPKADFFTIGGSSAMNSNSQGLGEMLVLGKTPYYSGYYFGSLVKTREFEVRFQYLSVMAGVLVGLQSYPNTGTPPDPVGYPHEFCHGATAYGPCLKFQATGGINPITLTVSHGDVVNSPINLPITGNDSQMLTVKINNDTNSYKVIRNYVEIASGTFPTPSTALKSLFRPYISVSGPGGGGSISLDYIWAKSNT